jgi:Transglutaminase-like superfamily
MGKIVSLSQYVKAPTLQISKDMSNGDTEDIISVILKNDIETAKAKANRQFAKLFETSDEYETCRKIYKNVQHNLVYEEDELGYEVIRMPAATIYTKIGDCEDFSLLIADLLRGVHGGKIRVEYWFISQNILSRSPHHIFPVAYLTDGTQVIMDAVYHSFDVAPMFFYKYVYDAAK